MSRIIRVALLATRCQTKNILHPVLIRHRPAVGGACERIFVEGVVLGSGDIGYSCRGNRRCGNEFAVDGRRKVIQRARAVEVFDAREIQSGDIGNADGPSFPEDAPLLAILAVIDEVQIGLEIISSRRNHDWIRGIKGSGILIDFKLVLVEGSIYDWRDVRSGFYARS